jgi:hypothetical protein
MKHEAFVRSMSVTDEVLIKALLQRCHGAVFLTESDLKRAEQLDVRQTWDGHRLQLSCRWP